MNYQEEINQNNEYGYAIMIHSYPNNKEVWTEDSYYEAVNTLKFVKETRPNESCFIRCITEEEANRYANIMAGMM